jgi:aminoglycoside phosphotransferase (APT) family kinase protein
MPGQTLSGWSHREGRWRVVGHSDHTGPMTDSTAGKGVGLGTRLGAGREAEVYAWGEDAVIKLYRPGFGGHHAEAAALAALEGHHIAPGLMDVVNRDGRSGLVLERVSGTDMLDLLRRRPWQVSALARTLARTHLAIHQVVAPTDLPDVRQVLAARIRSAALTPELRGFALRELDRLPSGDRLCHGDYHPGNVMIGADPATTRTTGARTVSVIDWPNAARGVPEADHARAVLLLRCADPDPGTPPLARALIAAGRSVLGRGYVRAYAAGAGRPPQDVESWLVVQIAARLAEGIDAERGRLVELLGRAWRKDQAR